jgi:uncharacterized glyoxalase superfamily protein PhnB
MSRAVKAVPEGQHTITPHLVARDAARAIEFYKNAFGATEDGRMNDPRSGKILHAQLTIGDSKLYLHDEMCEMGARSPLTIGGSAVTIHLYVGDVDVTVARAVEAGATVTMPVADMFWGDRYGKLVDPFGHEWSVATHIEDLTPAQMATKMDCFAPAT